MSDPFFKIVLHAPEIPGNTGSIGRTCLALNAELILIKPYGFDISEKAVRRAGLDYWKHVTLKEYDHWEHFLSVEKPEMNQVMLFENGAGKAWHEAPYKKGCYLVFGGETRGIPQRILDANPASFFSFPQYSNHIRSLNLSNIATAAAFECVRQINP
ncbi:MAG: tRNA (cytidine(34)-2'-O)-methyltransferase [Bacteriovoracaceae bacterium]|nr:tRNA (cytidine(34)-2'-O)-methyltransferase [Bacteriovoracaceae bacterium]